MVTAGLNVYFDQINAMYSLTLNIQFSCELFELVQYTISLHTNLDNFLIA